MRTLPRLRTLPLAAWPEMAWIPLVNLALLLTGLILISPVFISSTGISIQLPSAATAEVVGNASVVITVTDQKLIYVNGELMGADELEKRLVPLIQQKPSVLVKADRGVPMEMISQLWDICRKAGAAKISMATTHNPSTP